MRQKFGLQLVQVQIRLLIPLTVSHILVLVQRFSPVEIQFTMQIISGLLSVVDRFVSPHQPMEFHGQVLIQPYLQLENL